MSFLFEHNLQDILKELPYFQYFYGTKIVWNWVQK